jgi:hypothetical protein
VQVIFHYDSEEGWQYHDTISMPFPLSACSTIEEAVSKMTYTSSLLERAVDGSRDGTSSPNSEEAYWDGYASSNSSPIPFDSKLPNAAGDSTSAEDNYWASYSKVHGTADSEVPSPVNLTHQLHQIQDAARSHFQAYEDGGGSLGLVGYEEDPYDMRELGENEEGIEEGGRILSALPPPRIPSPASFGSILEEKLLEVSLNTPPREPEDEEEMQEEFGGSREALDIAEASQDVPAARVTQDKAADEDDGLRDMIRGVYKMWRARTVAPQDPTTFMQFVAQSLENL